MMKRPYEYNLTWELREGSLSLDTTGYRTGEDGKRHNFHNRNVFDGKDPRSAVEIEQAMNGAFGEAATRSEGPLGSVEKITMVLKGDQAKE